MEPIVEMQEDLDLEETVVLRQDLDLVAPELTQEMEEGQDLVQLEITLDLDLSISEEMPEDLDLEMAKDPDLVALEETVEMQEELDQAMLEEQGPVEGQDLEETKEIQEDQE